MLPGNTFASRFRLLKKVGVRGYAEVWQAVDETADESLVALKIFAPERGVDDLSLKLFYREYAELLSLQQPHLLTVKHFDVWQGYPFLVMPYCQGGSLYQRLLEEGALPEADIARMLMQVGSGLEFLHEKGIIHRDIKPDNVLIDKQGNFLLADFGISTQLRNILRKSSATDKVLSLAYAPPERFGSKQESRQAGDIFAIGVMLYELCTGEVPWMGAGGAVLREESILPDLPSSYSKALQALLQHCLQYDPSARPSAANIKSAGSYFVQHGQWPAPYIFQSPGPVASTIINEQPLNYKPIIGEAFDLPDEEEERIEETAVAEPEMVKEEYLAPLEILPVEEPVVNVETDILPAEEAVPVDNEGITEPDPPVDAEVSEPSEEAPLEIHAETAPEADNLSAVLPESSLAVPEPSIQNEMAGNPAEEQPITTIQQPVSQTSGALPLFPRKKDMRIRFAIGGTILILTAVILYAVFLSPGKDSVPLETSIDGSGTSMNDAREAFSAGDYLSAREYITQAKQECTDCTPVLEFEKVILDSMLTRYSVLIAEGDDLMVKRQFSAAREKYMEAAAWHPEGKLPEEKMAALQINETQATANYKGKLYGLKDLHGNTYNYSGEILNGVPHGIGSARYNNGSTYEGEYKNGRMSGNGKMTWVGGTSFLGQFLDDKYNGQGILIFPNGDRYVGEFRNGEKVGEGKFITGK